jgi:glycosyltransferase involved in cell wall biosynthesis
VTAASDTPPVTTVIAAFNAERFLGEAIESAFAQDYEPHDVIVVDDGSTDRTADVARSYERAKLIRQSHRGLAAALNAAIAAAEGEVIAYLDSDDLMPPGRLRTQVRYLLDHPEAGAVLGLQELLVEPGVDPHPGLGPDASTSADAPDEEDLPFEGRYVACSMAAWRRAFEKVGEYDTAFHHQMDVDWLMRLMESDMTVGTIDEVMVIRRVHGANYSYDQDAQRRFLFKAFKARIDRRRATGSATDPK